MTAWEHLAIILGALAAVVVGGVDLEVSHRLSTEVDATFITAGLAALGIKGGAGLVAGR